MHNLDDDTNATISLSSSDTGEATVAPATLTFTEGNWNTAQTVTVTGVNDTDSDRNQAYRISLISSDQKIDHPEVTTLAGSPSGSASSGSTNATGTAARFKYPQGITTDGTNLYVADHGNHMIRKIVIATGAVTTLAGSSSGYTDATGTSARFKNPRAITTDGTNLYVADLENHMIRKIVISTGAVTTLAGSTSSGSTDATGTSARFNYPQAIITDGTNLYVADTDNHLIRKIVIAAEQ